MSAEVCRELQPKPNFGSALANGFGCFIFYIFICPSTYPFTTTNPTLDPCLQLDSNFKRFLPHLRTSLAENSLLSFLSEFLSLEIIWSCCLLSLSCGEMPPLSSHKGFSPSHPRPALVGRKTHFVPKGCLSEVSHTLLSRVSHTLLSKCVTPINNAPPSIPFYFHKIVKEDIIEPRQPIRRKSLCKWGNLSSVLFLQRALLRSKQL